MLYGGLLQKVGWGRHSCLAVNPYNYSNGVLFVSLKPSARPTSLITPLKTGTDAAKHAVQRLSGRLQALEAIDHSAFRQRTLKAFGKELLPAEVVTHVVEQVRARGDEALFELTRKIDGAELKTLKVSDSERRSAFRRTDPAVRKALELSADRVREYQQRLMPADIKPAFGKSRHVKTGLMWTPIQRAGLYVPAGTAPLFSSVIMLAVPAQVAGVKELAIATPCNKEGQVNDGILCACEILGVKEIYKLGGAQAIAALAYGSKSVRAVDLIAGPGNLFVMLAKRAVFGQVNVDGLFGPSEVLIIADRHANPRFIAADLLAQAEHDTLASCVLLTDSADLAARTAAELALQLETLPRRDIATVALKDWGLILIAKNLDEAVEVANDLAPEHLELMTRNPQKWIPRLRTAGAIFVGEHSTEPLGDYLAGPSHTLPTGGTAKAFSGVSVHTFMRRTSIIEADAKGLAALAAPIRVLAEAEGLDGHARAVKVRSDG